MGAFKPAKPKDAKAIPIPNIQSASLEIEIGDLLVSGETALTSNKDANISSRPTVHSTRDTNTNEAVIILAACTNTIRGDRKVTSKVGKF